MPFNIFNRLMSPTLSAGLEIIDAIAGKSTDTLNWYKTPINQLIDLWGDIRVTAVTGDMVNEWSRLLDDTEYSEWTKNSYRRAVRAFFNHLTAVGHIEEKDNPVANLRIPSPPPAAPKYLPEEDVQKILQHARHDIRNNAIVRVLYDTGCRVSDLASMRVSNVHIRHRQKVDHLPDDKRELAELAYAMGLEEMLKPEYTLQHEGKCLVIGKGQRGKKKPRWVFFGHETSVAVTSYIRTRPATAGDRLWLSANGKPLAKNSYYHIFKKIAKDANVDASPHDMRHTFVHRLMRNGADPKMVQSLVGHSELQTTLTQYYNFRDDELWDLHRQFSQ